MSSAATHAFRCRCGAVQGTLADPGSAPRAVCYCKDCRAWAGVLGRATEMLDAAGGTSIVAVQPSNVRFAQGAERLACASFSPKGLLRWYASCCGAPMGNTVRDPRTHFVGFARLSLDPAPLPGESGPPAVRLFTPSATRPVAATPVAMAASVVGIGARMVLARIGGRWKRNPYFADVEHAVPLAPPRVIDRAARLAP